MENVQFKGVSTGFNKLYRILIGLKNGELTVLAARPGIGKTLFATAIE